MSSSIRQKKVESLLNKELSQIFNQANFIPGKMVSVSIVRISPDLQLAKVYLSIFPSNETDKDLLLVKENKAKIRLALGNIVKHQLRVVPDLNFYIDDSLDYVENIESLLKN